MSHAHSTHLPQSQIALRDNHIVILVVEAAAELYRSLRRWHSRRRTVKALADLSDAQLRDIGFRRADPDAWWPIGDRSARALRALDDGEAMHLSEAGRRLRRQALHGG